MKKRKKRNYTDAALWGYENGIIKGTHPFTDGAAGSYCHHAAAWAYQNKVTNGTGSTTFTPNHNCPR